MPVYSASSTQWPLLQNKTEQKFKSGLFNVSAEFIRPVGNTALPTVIETSIGPVDVWPDPTVSSGTDGFEHINATGYGKWSDVTENILSRQVVNILTFAKTRKICANQEGCGDGISCGGYFPPVEVSMKPLTAIVESIHRKTMGEPGVSFFNFFPLKAYDLNGDQIVKWEGEPIKYNVNHFKADGGLGITDEFFEFGTFEKEVSFSVQPTTVKLNNFGSVTESEVVIELVDLKIDFGTFFEKMPNGVSCE